MVINILLANTAPETLLLGKDSGLTNTWEEICVKVQGNESFYGNIYEFTVKEIIKGELETMPKAVSDLICFMGSLDNHKASREEGLYLIEDGEKAIYRSVIEAADIYTNEKIENYTDPPFDHNQDDEDENEDNEDNGYDSDEEAENQD
jgi:hypothetical protein